MPEQLIAPLIPSSSGRARGVGESRSRPVRPLPLADVAGPPGLPDVVYGMGRVDRSGRVADRVVSAAMGWVPGTRLTVTVVRGAVVAVADPGGLVTVSSRAYLPVPGPVRRRLGVRPGHRVLLAAAPVLDQLVIYPLSTVHRALGELVQDGVRS